MHETSVSPKALPETCPTCGGRLLLAPPDTSVPSYPVYSDVIPVPEVQCAVCGRSWVYQAGTVVRTATALAQVRHELRQARKAKVG